ncbi:hypothetical protein GSI_12009 [Ganoderma sinense ZZ0214-1]|uniref:Bacteriophage T5 Orf172 DNA-binding domain-containing protein n=1 Tax=Ganoderma sinense ZZ0214-1 TaxID=1077348 RepID=A0A2G8RXK8_9APHY|nr:hypothetical protein GSI_12009 [Ganoderma sinense ZZ0214-1]
MSLPALPSDGPGYIYALELAGKCCGGPVERHWYKYPTADASRPDLIRIKVGRSVDVHTRLSQHRNTCPSSRPRLLGYFPARTLSRRSPAVPFCDRLERLVHIELADISARSYPPARGHRRHTEIFVFKRLQGKRRGREWETIIRPVVERLARLVKRMR